MSNGKPADQHLPEALERDGYELGTEFYDLEALVTLNLAPSDRFYLQTALNSLRG